MVCENKIVRSAVVADLAELGVVGPAAYAAAYSDLWDDPAALNVQLATFSQDAFSVLLADRTVDLWVATWGPRTVGFLSLHSGSPEPVYNTPGGAEIRRIYLLPPARGSGLGRELVHAAMHRAIQTGHAYMWLDVMLSAEAPRRAYESWGFRVIGRTEFNGGVVADGRDMLVMKRELHRTAAAGLGSLASPKANKR